MVWCISELRICSAARAIRSAPTVAPAALSSVVAAVFLTALKLIVGLMTAMLPTLALAAQPAIDADFLLFREKEQQAEHQETRQLFDYRVHNTIKP